MMIRFYGRSSETHKMKNKLISLGYKFFVLATIIGFVVNFTLDSHRAEKTGNQEYEQGDNGKIGGMVLFIMSIIDKLKDRQRDRIKNYLHST